MPEPAVFILILGAVVVISAGMILLGIWIEERKRKALQSAADHLGLRYDPDKNPRLADQFGFLNQLAQGSNRYGAHALRGKINGHEVFLFEFHYETYSSNSKGGRRTNHHYYSVFTLKLPRSFPEMTIRREGLISKLAQAFGYEDIDFESAEFSRRFCVRSRDKKFAYAICHPLAMDFLMKHETEDIEIEGGTLAMVQNGPLVPDRIPQQLRLLLAFRQLMPEYLLKTTA